MARTAQQEAEVPVDGRRRHDKRRHNNQPYKRCKRGMTRGDGGRWCCRPQTKDTTIRSRGRGAAVGIITRTMIAETTMTMTTAASTEESLAAVADSDDAIGGGKASGGKTTINKRRG
jgi:hypothetical protein